MKIADNFPHYNNAQETYEIQIWKHSNNNQIWENVNVIVI